MVNLSAWLREINNIPSRWKDKVFPAPLVGQDPFLEDSRLRVFLLNANRLLEAKAKPSTGNPKFSKDLEVLLTRASSLLKIDAFTIIHKGYTPPSGTKHDYFSTGQYWWPNPDTPDGLPFIRKDGQANPDSESISDRNTLRDMIRAVSTLALAYFFTHDEDFSRKASSLLHAFFIDESTRMNPNLRYAQAVPGRSKGRGTGIIDATRMVYLVDAVGLLTGSEAWTEESHKVLTAWFKEYIGWLLHHPQGKSECVAKNNHGTSYDLHVTSVALFCGKIEVAKEILTQSVPSRMRRQIQPDGRQPQEIARPDSLNYCTQNLMKFFQLAVIGEKLGIDLWNYGRKLQGALDFLLPFIVSPSTWPYEQVHSLKKKRFRLLLLFGNVVYGEPRYRAALEKLGFGPGELEEYIYLPKDRFLGHQ